YTKHHSLFIVYYEVKINHPIQYLQFFLKLHEFEFPLLNHLLFQFLQNNIIVRLSFRDPHHLLLPLLYLKQFELLQLQIYFFSFLFQVPFFSAFVLSFFFCSLFFIFFSYFSYLVFIFFFFFFYFFFIFFCSLFSLFSAFFLSFFSCLATVLLFDELFCCFLSFCAGFCSVFSTTSPVSLCTFTIIVFSSASFTTAS